MVSEASNILRRFLAVAGQLDAIEYGYLAVAARTLRSEDLRALAIEVHEVSIRNARPRTSTVIRAGDPPKAKPKPLTPGIELRGLARSIIRYGGPDAVRRDADPALVDAVSAIGWKS